MYKGIVSPVQNGVGVKQVALDANPRNSVIKGDICKGYNKLAREGLLGDIKGDTKLHGTLAFKHTIFNPAG